MRLLNLIFDIIRGNTEFDEFWDRRTFEFLVEIIEEKNIIYGFPKKLFLIKKIKS